MNAERDGDVRLATGEHAVGGGGLQVWDRAGVMRMVRRHLDLSQRDLAAMAGVGSSTVNALESRSVGVSLRVVEAVLAAAGMRLAVLDLETGAEIAAEPVDVVRDHAGRRYPAHLDAKPAKGFHPDRLVEWRRDRPTPQVTFRHREMRDVDRVKRGAVATRHPTRPELAEARRTHCYAWPPDPREMARRGLPRINRYRLPGYVPRSDLRDPNQWCAAGGPEGTASWCDPAARCTRAEACDFYDDDRPDPAW